MLSAEYGWQRITPKGWSINTAMKYEYIVFDLDGTLLNTLEDLAGSMNHVLRERNFPTHDRSAYCYFVGGGALALIQRALPSEMQSDELIGDCVREFREQYTANWNVKTKLYDGVADMLDALSNRPVQMAIFSNKPDEFVKLCVREYFSKWEFAAVLGQRDGIPLKPDPGGALEAARSLNAEPRNVLYVGDTGTDMQTAVSAGMFPLGVLWGFRPEAELREHGAAALISEPSGLLKFVAEE
jgi:phosphoglycolate phosphatase